MAAKVLAFGGAELSEDRTKRYLLWRPTGVRGGKTCTFVMLNPSDADEAVDDATVRRCIGFAARWGFSTMKIVNLFAFRTPHPKKLAQLVDAAGGVRDTKNIARVRLACKDAFVVCAWGAHGKLNGQDERVARILELDGVRLHALGFCANGCPKHPVRLPSKLTPVPWRHERCVWECNLP
jgi:hypothetical protein